MSPMEGYLLIVVAGAASFWWSRRVKPRPGGIPEVERRRIRAMGWSGLALAALGAVFALRHWLAEGGLP